MILFVTTVRLDLAAVVVIRGFQLVIEVYFARSVELCRVIVVLQVDRWQLEALTEGHVPLVLVFLLRLNVLVFVLLQLTFEIDAALYRRFLRLLSRDFLAFIDVGRHIVDIHVGSELLITHVVVHLQEVHHIFLRFTKAI